MAGLPERRRRGTAARPRGGSLLPLGPRRRPLQHGHAGSGRGRQAGGGQRLEVAVRRAGDRLLQAQPDLFHAAGFPAGAPPRSRPAGPLPLAAHGDLPTSRSLAELAARFDVPVFNTPVGFKHFGNACARLEEQIRAGAGELSLQDARDREHRFARDTRVLLMAEESGGAAMAGWSRCGAGRAPGRCCPCGRRTPARWGCSPCAGRPAAPRGLELRRVLPRPAGPLRHPQPVLRTPGRDSF